MRRNDLTMTLALCASLAVHGALATVFWVDAARAARLNTAAVRPPAHAADAPLMIIDPDDVFGSDKGTGNAPNEFTSDQVLQAPFAPHPQASLSRDPQGLGRIGNPPAPPKPVQSKLEQNRLLADRSPIASQFGPPLNEDLAMPSRSRALSAAPANHRAVQNRTASDAAPAADPAPMSDSESDPFSDKPSVTISEGAVEAHLGRKVKTVRPRLSLPAQLDLLGLQFPTMQLRVHLDAEGKVKKVDILKSSGSESADQEVKVAVYQWRFAPRPARAAHGGDIVQFDVVWR